MIRNRCLNNKNNHIHDKVLCVVCNDYKSKFEEFIDKCQSVTLLDCNNQQLAIEVLKTKVDLSPFAISEMFKFSENCL